MNEPLSDLCRSLGHDFGDQSILLSAVTHRSFGPENNERLEFLGDAILGFIIGEILYERFADADEGQLTRLRASLVRKDTLAALARRLELGRYLKLGEGERKSGGWRRDSILANCLEAIIGAVYIDAGFSETRKCVLAIFDTVLESVSPRTLTKDAKTQLQEFLQARRLSLPSYELISMEGEPHNQTFTVRCSIPCTPQPIEAQGTSKQRAEQAAARKVLQLLRSGDAQQASSQSEVP